MVKILVVDDSFLIGAIIKKIVEKRAYHVVKASNSGEALKMFKEEHPRIVFMDIILEGNNDKSGIDALREIKQIQPEIPVVMCSSIGKQEKIEKECIKAGAYACLGKPFTEEQILQVIDEIMEDS
jgi:two-component system, chemotaxis family, chemotaxis protein CheY